MPLKRVSGRPHTRAADYFNQITDEVCWEWLLGEPFPPPASPALVQVEEVQVDVSQPPQRPALAAAAPSPRKLSAAAVLDWARPRPPLAEAVEGDAQGRAGAITEAKAGTPDRAQGHAHWEHGARSPGPASPVGRAVPRSSPVDAHRGEDMWLMARRKFADGPPFSDGRDQRYESVKAQLRAVFGHSAINASNKAKLKRLAICRGLDAPPPQMWEDAAVLFADGTAGFSNGHDKRYEVVKAQLRREYGDFFAPECDPSNKLRLKALAAGRGVLSSEQLEALRGGSAAEHRRGFLLRQKRQEKEEHETRLKHKMSLRMKGHALVFKKVPH